MLISSENTASFLSRLNSQHDRWAVCARTSENLRGAVLPPLPLPAPAKAGSGRALPNTLGGAEGQKGWDNYRKTDSDWWVRGTETPSIVAGAIFIKSPCLFPPPTHPHFKPHCAPWSSCSANQEDAPILTLRVPVVYPVADIFGYFGGAVGALFLLLFLLLQYIPEIWEAAGLHGGDADSPGCQHPQSDQSPQRQLPLFAAGPVDHQRWLAWLFEVLKSFSNNTDPYPWPLAMLVR